MKLKRLIILSFIIVPHPPQRFCDGIRMLRSVTSICLTVRGLHPPVDQKIFSHKHFSLWPNYFIPPLYMTNIIYLLQTCHRLFSLQLFNVTSPLFNAASTDFNAASTVKSSSKSVEI